MKNIVSVILMLALLLSFCACGGNNTALTPCVMLSGELFFPGETVLEDLPAGFEKAGVLSRVEHIPEEDLTACGFAGGDVYCSSEKPEIAYVYIEAQGHYACFTAQALRDFYVFAGGVLYVMAPESEAPDRQEIFARCEKLGSVETAVSDAYPTGEFQTNNKNFVGYGVYVPEGEKDVMYLVSAYADREPIGFAAFGTDV